MAKKCRLGQYFTTHPMLQEKVFEFILNNPSRILEPSVGRGDLVKYVQERMTCAFDMFEIDPSIELLESVSRDDVVYGDFLIPKRPSEHHCAHKACLEYGPTFGQKSDVCGLKSNVATDTQCLGLGNTVVQHSYQTIIGNPPYIRTKKGNLYLDFIKKCVELLEPDGELIFIVPSDFFKLTCAALLLDSMMQRGTFTHIFHPNQENLFENATIDVLVFRYILNPDLAHVVLYNGVEKQIVCCKGLLTFNEKTDNQQSISKTFQDIFHIYVGLVSGKEEIYKHDILGNITVQNGRDKYDKYIYIDEFPSNNPAIDAYLLSCKDQLITRKIRKFNEKNWFEWGAPRNMAAIKEHWGKPCIYVYTITRNPVVAFQGTVGYFGGGLLMLVPKESTTICNTIAYLNSDEFKSNFMYSGRFKIGHRQLAFSRFHQN